MQYLVYRYGSNAFNQTRQYKMPLCVVEAKSAQEARQIAEQYHVLSKSVF